MLQRITSAIAIAALAVGTLGAGTALADGNGMGGSGGGSGHDMGGGGHGMNHMKEKNAPVVPGAREIKVDATLPKFTPNQITVAAGENVTIVLTSNDLFHDFMVQGKGHVVGAKAHKTAKGGLRIDMPGTYKFWCSVRDHRAAGMKGTIVVQ